MLSGATSCCTFVQQTRWLYALTLALSQSSVGCAAATVACIDSASLTRSAAGVCSRSDPRANRK